MNDWVTGKTGAVIPHLVTETVTAAAGVLRLRTLPTLRLSGRDPINGQARRTSAALGATAQRADHFQVRAAVPGDRARTSR